MRVFRRLLNGAVVLLGLAGSCQDPTASDSSSFGATLRGRDEFPANASTASGSATVAIIGKTLTYEVSASGFATPLVVAHIHIGARGENGPVIVPFTILAQSGTIARGSVDLSGTVSYNTLSISGDSLRSLVQLGLTYVNLHTAAYPGGEIRGQLVRQ